MHRLKSNNPSTERRGGHVCAYTYMNVCGCACIFVWESVEADWIKHLLTELSPRLLSPISTSWLRSYWQLVSAGEKSVFFLRVWPLVDWSNFSPHTDDTVSSTQAKLYHTLGWYEQHSISQIPLLGWGTVQGYNTSLACKRPWPKNTYNKN